ncbi:KPN_02809 family neutral zinc metallopeptidase [Lysinibacter cavernae]|uniref:Neutral zinc metallopeptidase n=1 Tax=Lysinibacter cavernae TaxID=1640652 RepID=A0A7X5TUE6_9MICO|nr:neutral zinc metallopeptidase [Lysinibacter cavernae]NIH54308.1 hypothetical protein [Lysinibacter cavernae]
MTFNENARLDPSRVRRTSGRRGAVVGGGSVLGVIAIVVLSQLFGVDLSGLLGGGATSTEVSSTSTSESLEHCTTGSSANEDVDCRMVGAYNSLNTYWAGQVDGYRDPGLNLFTQSVSTRCGNATSATGPFYCPGDETIYIDTDFFDVLQSQFGATGGELSQMYIIAHEAGHHISTLTGAMSQADRSGTGPASDSVRIELQADCYAGAWVGSATTIKDSNGVTFLEPVTKAQIADALDAAATVGDDRIQQQGTGQINPDAWTHGSSEQRQRWFTTGMTSGPQSCDTLTVPAGQL